jgi:hypothetical protein
MLLLTALVFISTSVRVERGHAQESVGPASTETHVFTKDMTIYVSDFDLDAAIVKIDSCGAAGGVRPKIIESPRKREEKDPQARRRGW